VKCASIRKSGRLDAISNPGHSQPSWLVRKKGEDKTMKRTERQYTEEQARLRAIAWNEALPQKQRDEAQADLQALCKQYQIDYPMIRS